MLPERMIYIQLIYLIKESTNFYLASKSSFLTLISLIVIQKRTLNYNSDIQHIFLNLK